MPSYDFDAQCGWQARQEARARRSYGLRRKASNRFRADIGLSQGYRIWAEHRHRPDTHTLESEIMIGILMELKAQGIVALPIHDCIIVSEQHRDVGTQMMMRKFKEVVGLEAVVKCEGKSVR